MQWSRDKATNLSSFFFLKFRVCSEEYVPPTRSMNLNSRFYNELIQMVYLICAMKASIIVKWYSDEYSNNNNVINLKASLLFHKLVGLVGTQHFVYIASTPWNRICMMVRRVAKK